MLTSISSQYVVSVPSSDRLQDLRSRRFDDCPADELPELFAAWMTDPEPRVITDSAWQEVGAEGESRVLGILQAMGFVHSVHIEQGQTVHSAVPVENCGVVELLERQPAREFRFHDPRVAHCENVSVLVANADSSNEALAWAVEFLQSVVLRRIAAGESA